MNKDLRLPVDIQLKRHPGQSVLILSFRGEALRDWCLGLCLLKERLIDSLTVTEDGGGRAVKLQVLANPKIPGRISASFGSDRSQLEIPTTSLEYIQAFFLRYYRDEMADVDHIDMEAIDAATGKQDEYVIFRVPDSKPAVSPAEAGRRLRG
jgi:hypothetical protein